DVDFTGKIGIITPYKGQLREMKTRFAARYGNEIFSKVDFNTTDAFQGRESEVIIFSCVRASNKGIGFLSDIRRMNVGLTRAKSSLWVLGNSQSLVQGEFWKSLIVNARSRSVYTDGNVLKLLERPQFTGYKNVEMMDIDAPSRPASAASISRPPSSVSLGNLPSDSPSVSISASGKGTPTSTGPAPSGGGNGLDETKTCGYCGSAAHTTPLCDNIDAKETSQGTCHRCGGTGHHRRDCVVERCVDCGECGHVSSACVSTNRLPKRDKARLVREESALAMVQRNKAQRQRERQLGGHDPRVPAVRVDVDPAGQVGAGGSVKRKRGEGDGGKAARPKSAAPPGSGSGSVPAGSGSGSAAPPAPPAKGPAPGSAAKGSAKSRLDAKPPQTTD
ncbi:DEAD-box type RNA helicase, partial [Elasticomyces elasticus]